METRASVIAPGAAEHQDKVTWTRRGWPARGPASIESQIIKKPPRSHAQHSFSKHYMWGAYALISMMARSTTRPKQRPDTLMQDLICRIDENLLQHAAGPYIRVKTSGLARYKSKGSSPNRLTWRKR